jgi:hypothetical protein
MDIMDKRELKNVQYVIYLARLVPLVEPLDALHAFQGNI